MRSSAAAAATAADSGGKQVSEPINCTLQRRLGCGGVLRCDVVCGMEMRGEPCARGWVVNASWHI